MLRRMTGRKRHKEMPLEDFMIETNRVIKNLKLKHQVMDWDIVALRHHFGWAGHICRLSVSDPDRVTGKIMKYRDRNWLQNIERENYGRQLHCRRLRIWRWERPLYKYALSTGIDNWHELAFNKRDWISTIDLMATWFRHHRA